MRNSYRVEDDLVYIELRRKDGSVVETITNLDFLPKLLDYDICWSYLDKGKKTPYVVGRKYVGNKKAKTIQFHRFILDAPPNMVVHHINGNGLDNRKENLEIVTNQENIIKRIGLNKNNTSGIRGVSYDRSRGKWQVKFKKNYKTIHFGRYDSIEEAEMVARKAFREVFGLEDETKGA